MINFFFMLIFFGVYSLCLIRKHVFLCLISLELVIIYLMIIFYYFFSFNFNYMYMYIIMMSFFVCEGVLGLSVIVLLVRCHSNDYLNSMMMW